MCWRDLRRFWIVSPDQLGPLGFGVTAFSLDDALEIIRGVGYRLPDDLQGLQVTEDVEVDLLDPHVQQNMGPTAVRGIWYPFWFVGVPPARTKD